MGGGCFKGEKLLLCSCYGSLLANDNEPDRALHIHNADCFFRSTTSFLLNYITVKVKTVWEGCCADAVLFQD